MTPEHPHERAAESKQTGKTGSRREVPERWTEADGDRRGPCPSHHRKGDRTQGHAASGYQAAPSRSVPSQLPGQYHQTQKQNLKKTPERLKTGTTYKKTCVLCTCTHFICNSPNTTKVTRALIQTGGQAEIPCGKGTVFTPAHRMKSSSATYKRNTSTKAI